MPNNTFTIEIPDGKGLGAVQDAVQALGGRFDPDSDQVGFASAPSAYASGARGPEYLRHLAQETNRVLPPWAELSYSRRQRVLDFAASTEHNLDDLSDEDRADMAKLAGELQASN